MGVLSISTAYLGDGMNFPTPAQTPQAMDNDLALNGDDLHGVESLGCWGGLGGSPFSV